MKLSRIQLVKLLCDAILESKEDDGLDSKFRNKIKKLRKGSRSSRVKQDILIKFINDNYHDNHIDYLLLYKDIKPASLSDDFGPLNLTENVYVDLDDNNTNYIEVLK